jgi:flagellar basal body rod protein FlgG
MSSTSSIALSGMNAAQQQLNASASNIANLGTPGYRRQEVTQSANAEGGVSTKAQRAAAAGEALEADVVAQLQAKNAYLANLAVFKAADKMAGALLDETA